MVVLSIIICSYTSESGGVGYEHMLYLVALSAVFVALFGQLSSPPPSYGDQLLKTR